MITPLEMFWTGVGSAGLFLFAITLFLWWTNHID